MIRHTTPSIRRDRGSRSRKYPRTNLEAVRIPQVDHGNVSDVPPGFENLDVSSGFRKHNQLRRDNGDGVLNPNVPPGSRKRIWNQRHCDNLYPDVPPGFRKQNQRPHDNGDGVLVPGIMVAQLLEGVIEAEFDGGFLLRIGCGKLKVVAGGILRGVAYRHRRARTFANNGVAPDDQMRKRDETRSHRNQNVPSSERTRTGCKARAANLVNPSIPTVSPFAHEIPPGFFLPVVFKPVNLSDSLPAPTQGGTSDGVTASTQEVSRLANDGSTINNQKVFQGSMRAKQRTQAEKAGSSKRKFDERETNSGRKFSEMIRFLRNMVFTDGNNKKTI